jgi:hypothetical protein
VGRNVLERRSGAAPNSRRLGWACCRDDQVDGLAPGYEDVLVAVVVERLAGESAIESFQP